MNLAKANNLSFLETSAKHGINIDQVFQVLTRQVKEKIE